jgi:hypothetical protein
VVVIDVVVTDVVVIDVVVTDVVVTDSVDAVLLVHDMHAQSSTVSPSFTTTECPELAHSAGPAVSADRSIWPLDITSTVTKSR